MFQLLLGLPARHDIKYSAICKMYLRDGKNANSPIVNDVSSFTNKLRMCYSEIINLSKISVY